MKNSASVWNLYAPVYDLFMRQNRRAYEIMYRRIRRQIRGLDVLELACGTGLISRHTASAAKSYLATDFAEGMLAKAQQGRNPANLRFQREDAAALTLPDHSFDAVIISNALHIVPDPAAVLAESARVLRKGGLLIAPNFTHDTSDIGAQLMSRLLTAAGIAFESKWNAADYAQFLRAHGFCVRVCKTLKAAIPLTYTESRRMP